jgi:carboxypeptidase C (cathepsin A)
MTRFHALPLLALVAAASTAVRAAPAGDLITSLPGWGGPFPSPLYSGFLSAGQDQIHYILATAESPGAPLCVWLNGGPGCSSLIGAWLEQGPLTMNGDGTLTLNDGRWSTMCNTLFIESPAGVGFSYTPGTTPSHTYVANDTSTAATNVLALASFYAAFPEYASTPLWLSGESYAGVYVPMFAAALLASSVPQKANLKGIFVGNGAAATGDWYEAGLVEQRFLHAFQHSLVSPATAGLVNATCSPSWLNRSDACNNALAQYATEMGPLDVYNIEVTCSVGRAGTEARRIRAVNRAFRLRAGLVDPAGRFSDRADACSAADDALAAYLNQGNVQAALHVTAAAAALGGWAACSSNLSYTREPQDERVTVYPALIAAMHVIIYNGDQDECIPVLQDEAWTATMGFPVKSGWRPWIYDDQVAGYVVDYAVPAGGAFTFVTVKRAGHEVPTFQPQRAQAMVQRIISGQAL